MSIDVKNLKVAIITDWMYAPGGSDYHMKTLLDVVPQADIFTSIYFKEKYQGIIDFDQDINTTFLQKLPFKRLLYRHFNVLAPFAFEELDLREYDIVISLSAGPGKGVITSVDQPYIGIILTPPRYLWDREFNTRGLLLRPLYEAVTPIVRHFMRIWDYTTVKRIDHIVSISEHIARKVKNIYRRDSEVIYPGIESYWFEEDNYEGDFETPDKFFFILSRLYQYKRIDWTIKACERAEKHLVIMGRGPDRKSLEDMVERKDLIHFVDHDRQLGRHLYTEAEAFIFSGVEDFGLVNVESMACGTPVLAYDEGGSTETILKGKTGDFFHSIDGLVDLLKKFDSSKYKVKDMKERAKLFTEERLVREFKKYLGEICNGNSKG